MIDRDDVDHGSMDGTGPVVVRHAVPPRLAGLVHRMTGYREIGGRPARMIEPASLVVPIILSFGDCFALARDRDPGPDDRYGSFTAGLTAGPVRTLSGGAAHCLQIDLTPLGARRFFGMPMRALSEHIVPLDALGDPFLPALEARLGAERRWSRRFTIAEAAMQTRLEAGQAPDPAVAWAYGRIAETGGTLRIGTLADRLGWSRRHLAARFREEVGLAPKVVARIARFGRAEAMAAAGHGTGWADIAAACGYADQAHLTREFAALAGYSPASRPAGR